MGKEGRAAVGEVSWDNVEVKSGGGGGFKKLEVGDNKVRIISNPIEFQSHWVPQVNRRVICIGDGCPACKTEVKVMQRWMLKIIDRADSQVKILETGSEIMSGVVALVQNADWGKIHKYDITITRVEGKRTSYKVVPCPKKNPAFTDEEKEAINDSKESINLKKVIEAQVKNKSEIQQMLKGEMPIESKGNSSKDDDSDFLNEDEEKKSKNSKKAVKDDDDDDFLDLDS